MPITKYNDFISQVGAGIWLSQPWWGEVQTATQGLFSSTTNFNVQRCGNFKAFPSLPGGVTGYYVTSVTASSSTTQLSVLIAKTINLGSIDISGASGTFTDGSAMPSVTELGVATTYPSIVIAEVVNVLAANPGSISITYVDQDGNAAEASTAQAMTASSVPKTCGNIELNAGDVGVRDITAATRTGGTTPIGTIKFHGIVPVCLMEVSPVSGSIVSVDNLITGGFNIPKFGASDQLIAFILGSTTTKCCLGDIFVVGDN